MARSLGLAAYRALARRKEAPLAVPAPPRPKGELVWIHAGEMQNLLAVRDLAQRLVNSRQNLHVLISTPPEQPRDQLPPFRSNPAIHEAEAPSEHPVAVEGFLDHWRPSACLWVWGGLRPNLILAAGAQQCPLFLLDADVTGFEGRRDRWLPEMTRQMVRCFRHILCRSDVARGRLINLGAQPDIIELTTALVAGGQPLPCSETDLDELSAALGGRPTWFAADVHPKEIPVVLAAHRQASRLSHRLLLILQPAANSSADQVAELAGAQDMLTASWDEGEFPDETTQILISESAEERGLFYRVAPVSFLGTTLVQDNGGCDPLEAAALGSAILYGPKVRHFMPFYSRLAAAGAARIINDADALGAAVSSLIAPDHAAAMAHAGWDVISQGAALTDKVVDLVQDTLDQELARA